jgi:hypothetical protein
MTTILGLIQEIRRPTDPYWILLRARSTSRQRHKAARRIAATMSTTFANPAARLALKRAHRGEGARWLRETLFVSALLEAARERYELQRIRLGAKWVTDADGRIAPTRPMDHSLPFLRRWLRIHAARSPRRRSSPAR